MRGFICFIAACTIYILGGLLVWSIVSTMIDIPSSTIEELQNYRLYSYSGFAALITFVVLLFTNADDTTYEILLGAIAIGTGIGIVANVYELSGGIALTLTIICNIINVGALTLSLYIASNK